MPRLNVARFLVAWLIATAACSEPMPGPMEPPGDVVPPALVAAGSTTQAIVVTLALGTDLASDGKGAYQTGVCGVSAWWTTSGTDWTIVFAPTGDRIQKSQAAACAGIAPRAATMRLGLRHLSSSPHVDDPAPASGGVFGLANIKLYSGGGAIINAPTACFNVSQSGRVTGKGLRLDADNFPGSNDLVRTDLGGGRWRFYTASWPDNLAWCEDNSGTSLWHLTVDLEVQTLD